MKKIITIVLLIVIVVSLVACSNPDARFERMGRGGDVDGSGTSVVYYRDKQTDVVYVAIHQSLSIIVKADGTPYLWSEFERENFK